MNNTNKEINWDFKKKQTEERHETFRLLLVVIGIVTVVCSIVWGIVIYNLEAVKHPVNYNYTNQTDIDYKRR